MELTYPLILYIGIIVVAVIFVFTIKDIKSFKGGRKAANTTYVKDIPHYKVLMFEYSLLKVVLVVSLIVSILLGIFIASKPTEVRTVTKEMHNRDIFICFDVSTSLDSVSIELCEQLKDFVSELKGERFGISIFNSTSIMLCPLTDDYDYVLEILDTLEDSINAGYNADYYYDIDDMYSYGYRFAGTIGGNSGSSLIGDGLATCLYSFPDLDENPDRSRLIVFVTDNDLLGTPVVTINEACDLCSYRNVKVFALAPDFVVNENNFKNAINSTEGGYYNTRNKKAMEDMLEEVQNTDVSASYSSYTSEVDVPEIAIVALVCTITLYFVCAWRLRL
ncbi:MAG: hypothetical protein IJ869_03685 [Clostridiales bacterium]|nr:hypothetical protein [Clostridiales bacterium]